MTEKVDMLKLLGNISDSGFEKVMVGTQKCADPLFKVSDIAEIKDDKLTMVSRENKSLQEEEEHASNKITYVHAYPYCQMSLQP